MKKSHSDTLKFDYRMSYRMLFFIWNFSYFMWVDIKIMLYPVFLLSWQLSYFYPTCIE